MFVILVYDIGEKRVQNVHKVCKKYLTWVQKSVFEGEITEANLLRLINEIKEVIDESQDSVLIYNLEQRHITRDKRSGYQNHPTKILSFRATRITNIYKRSSMWGVMRWEREGLKEWGSKNSILMGERRVYSGVRRSPRVLPPTGDRRVYNINFGMLGECG
jgi:CRISPR-associated protein Cas2